MNQNFARASYGKIVTSSVTVEIDTLALCPLNTYRCAIITLYLIAGWKWNNELKHPTESSSVCTQNSTRDLEETRISNLWFRSLLHIWRKKLGLLLLLWLFQKKLFNPKSSKSRTGDNNFVFHQDVIIYK